MKRADQAAKRPAFLNSDNSYDLLVPISYSVGTEQITVRNLKLRRLTAADMMIGDGENLSMVERLLRTIEAMTDLPRAATLKLDAVDIDRVDEVLGHFATPGSVTGATS